MTYMQYILHICNETGTVSFVEFILLPIIPNILEDFYSRKSISTFSGLLT